MNYIKIIRYDNYFLFEVFFFLVFGLPFFFVELPLSVALAAANLAIGTLNGEQLT
jgi:hypothetical protein